MYEKLFQQFRDQVVFETTSALSGMLDYEPVFNINQRLILAYNKDGLYSLLKLLCYLAIVDANGNNNNATLTRKAVQWYNDAQELLTEIKAAQVSKFSPEIPQSNKLNAKQKANLSDRMKIIRDSLWAKRSKLNGNPAFNSNIRRLFGALMTYLNSHSESSLTTITQNMHLLNDPTLNASIDIKSKHNTDDTRQELIDFVQSIGGKGELLTPAQLQKLKTKSPDSYKEYNRLRNNFKNSLKLEIRRIVRQAGGLVDAEVLRDQLDEMGLPTDFIPEQFTGKYDEDSNLYNDKGVRFNNNQAGGWLILNKNYDPQSASNKWLAKGQTPMMQKPALYYSKDHVIGQRQNEKFTKVSNNLENIENIKSAWRENLTSRDPQTKINAMMIELLYRTGMRMSSPNAQSLNRKTNKIVRTYGLSTLQVRHVNELSDGLSLIFDGKANVRHKLRLKQDPNDPYINQLINYIKQQCRNKSPQDYVFTINGRRTTPTDVKNALNEAGWEGGPHKMRHALGTQLLQKLLAEKKLAANADLTRTNNYVDSILKEVGKRLGHVRIVDGKAEDTGTTARQSYVDPSMLIKVYRDRNLNLPNWLEKLEKTNEDENE